MAKYELSKHTYFVNPYNFVPVEWNVNNRKDATARDGERLTGYLDCALWTRTPLAVPDTANAVEDYNIEENREKPKEKQLPHRKYDFLQLDGQPYIPGSSIRGVVRSIYETATNSCLAAMAMEQKVTARSGSAFDAGLLCRNEAGKWELFPAKRHLIVLSVSRQDERFIESHGIRNHNDVKLVTDEELGRYHSGDKVYFSLSKAGYKTKKGFPVGTYVQELSLEKRNNLREGYISIGEETPNRHFQSLFEKSGGAVATISDSEIGMLEYVLQQYRDAKLNTKYPNEHKGYPDYKEAKDKGVIPVYYKEINGRRYLSLAALGRMAFYKNPNDLVKEKMHQKCDKRTALCPACALFGTAEGEKLGNRVRFTDALCQSDPAQYLKRKVTFEELASPKESYFPFYLKSQDYKAGYDAGGVSLRGRKFYWHHMPEDTQVKKTGRNGTFRVMEPGAEFTFRVYFEDVICCEL